MRIGKRMREILTVLNSVREPLTITEIIMRIKGIYPYRTHHNEVKDDQGNWVIHKIEKPWPPYIQCELASAIAEKSLSWETPTSVWINEKKTGKKYHPITYANKWYALYSRSVRLLLEHGLISSNERTEGRRWKGNRVRYGITDKGRTLQGSSH